MNLTEVKKINDKRIERLASDIEEERQERAFRLGLTADNAHTILDAIDKIKEGRK